jgi:hypothetical protein
LQTWLQYLSLSTTQLQLAWAHFFGSDIASPPFTTLDAAKAANGEA